MGFDFQKKVVTVTLQTVTKLFNIGGLKIVWTVHAPSILPISCRRDLSFDFAQDGELVEPPVAILSSPRVRDSCKKGLGEAVFEYRNNDETLGN